MFLIRWDINKWSFKVGNGIIVGIVSGFIGSTESEPEKSERFHFPVTISITTPSFMIY